MDRCIDRKREREEEERQRQRGRGRETKEGKAYKIKATTLLFELNGLVLGRLLRVYSKCFSMLCTICI